MGASEVDNAAIVEAGYTLDRSRPEWLEGVLEASAPGLDRGLGAYAMLVEPPGPRAGADGRVLEVVQLGCPAPIVDALERYRSRPASSLGEVLSRGNGRLRTDSEIEAAASGRRELPAGVADHLALSTRRTGAVVLVLGAMLPRPATTRSADRRLWERLAEHLAAGLRLRRHIEVESDRAGSTEGLDWLRRQALAKASAEGAKPARATLLRPLCEGRYAIVDRWELTGGRYLLARVCPASAPDPRALTRREMEVSDRVARGETNAEVARALGLGESTVGTHVGRTLRKLGSRRREELVRLAAEAEIRSLELAGDRYVLARMALSPAARAVLDRLSPSERAVARLAVEGLSDRAIAARRRTTSRTVSNQLRSVFIKLSVRSRAELAARLRGVPAPSPQAAGSKPSADASAPRSASTRARSAAAS